jgi:hypothetical protein
VADFLAPYLAYCSNEQVFLSRFDDDQGYPSFQVLSTVLTVHKVKKTRCVAVCIINEGERYFCVIALRNHLMVVKQIDSGDNGIDEGEELLIQTQSPIIGLKWVPE